LNRARERTGAPGESQSALAVLNMASRKLSPLRDDPTFLFARLVTLELARNGETIVVELDLHLVFRQPGEFKVGDDLVALAVLMDVHSVGFMLVFYRHTQFLTHTWA
jgi:hypothetical protein